MTVIMNEDGMKSAVAADDVATDTTNLPDEQSNTAEKGQESDIMADFPETGQESDALSDFPETGQESDRMADEEGDALSWQTKYASLNDAHLRLMAEFDNYRKRTMREKAELIKAGGESILTGLLPVVDDLERAMRNIRSATDMVAVGEGMELIYAKFNAFLSQQGVKPIETIGLPFDMETSDAIATAPAPDEDAKNKVIDCTETGYTLHGKVLRHAKVVVGE